MRISWKDLKRIGITLAAETYGFLHQSRCRHYVFRVKGSNNDGIWNEEGVSLMIKIRPPFWKTWIFRIAVLLILASLVYFFVKQRMAQTRRIKKFWRKRSGKEKK